MESARPELFLDGLRYEIHKTITETDTHLWAYLTGEREGAPMLPAFARQQAQRRRAVQSGYMAGLLVEAATRLAAHTPAPGATLVRLSADLLTPVPVGTTLLVRATVSAWDPIARLYWLDLGAIRADGRPAITGVAALRPNVPLVGPR